MGTDHFGSGAVLCLAQDAGVCLWEEIEKVFKTLAALIQNISNVARQQASSAGHISKYDERDSGNYPRKSHPAPRRQREALATSGQNSQ
jgi:hypothetical protein